MSSTKKYLYCQGATVLTYEGCGNKILENSHSQENFECHVDWSESDDSYYIA